MTETLATIIEFARNQMKLTDDKWVQARWEAIIRMASEELEHPGIRTIDEIQSYYDNVPVI